MPLGLVSDFLSECWNKLRTGSRAPVMQGRVHLGGALSGRDIEAVSKTVSGMLKLLFHRESRKLLGVHVIGESATEIIHIGQAVMALGGTIDYFREVTTPA